MCWSFEASAGLAVIGAGVAAYTAYKKESPALSVTLGYFALMEALQAYTYTVINQCSLPANQIVTILSYLHIVFQPFFINAVAMYFIPDAIRRKIQYPVYILCFISAMVMLLQVYPFEWAGACRPGRPMCSDILCSVSGSWHLAWKIPLNGIGNEWWNTSEGLYLGHGGFITYIATVFIVPLLYGSWRFTAYQFIMGPVLALLLTSNVNEQPAIWCLFSVALLVIALLPPIRRHLFVHRWVFYKG
jgi:hypothetical protein